MQLNDSVMDRKMQDYQVKGVSVSLIEEGRLKAVKNYGVTQANSNHKVDDKAIFNACSISKLSTMVLVMNLVSQGVLHLDENINRQLRSWQVPENKFTIDHKVTLRSLLCHQGGFVDPEGSFETFKEGVRPLLIEDLLCGKSPYVCGQAEVKYVPNTDCIYSDLGYCIIELLVTDVLGMPFKNALNQMVLEPLGMADSWIIESPRDIKLQNFAKGHTKEGLVLELSQSIYPYSAAAGLWCTAKDLSLLLIEVYDLIKGKGKLEISPLLMAEVIKPQGCKPWSGLGLFLDQVENHLEISSFGWGVGFQCMLVGFPLKGTGVVVMTNTDTGVHQLKGFIKEVLSLVDGL